MKQIKRDKVKGKRGVDFLKEVHLHFTFFLLTFTLPAYAGDPGSSTANSLKIGAGARAVGMGEAATAVSDDVYANYWNPAGLARQALKEAAFMHAQLVENIANEYVALAVPSEIGAFGGSLSYLSYGAIEGFDNNGNSVGTLQKSYDMFGSVSYGRLLGDKLSFGLTGRYIYKRLVSDSASTLATDLGVQYKTLLDGLTVAGVVQNLGGTLTFIQDSNPLPRTFKLGTAYQRGMALVAMDLWMPRDQSAFVTAGLELKPIPWAALRAGWKSKDEVSSGFRVGAGFNFLEAFTLDYAFMPFGAFGNTHRISLSYRWGQKSENLILSESPHPRPYIPKKGNGKTNKARKKHSLMGCVPRGDALLNLLSASDRAGICDEESRKPQSTVGDTFLSPDSTPPAEPLPDTTLALRR